MRSIIVGASGQDGSILLDKLLSEGETVLAISKEHTFLYSELCSEVEHVNILNPDDVVRAIRTFIPDHIYYLAAYHHSSEDKKPEAAILFKNSFDIHVFGVLNFLEAIKDINPGVKLFYASSSLIFGSNPEVDLATEETPWQPDCAYGVSKVAGMNLCAFYRDCYNLFATCGILFNHESCLRKETFVSRKIISGIFDIISGKKEFIEISDLNAAADFGYAPDFIEAIYKLVQLDVPDDFIIATGKVKKIKNWLETAFSLCGMDWKEYIVLSPNLSRKRKALAGDITKLNNATKWLPSHSFEGMLIKLLNSEASRRKMKSPVIGNNYKGDPQNES